jgi:DNA-binding NtrC family response regulator
MLFNKKRYTVVLHAIAVCLIQVFFLTSTTVFSQDFADFLPKRISNMKLAIWDTSERDCPMRMRGDAYRRLFEDGLAPAYGGKGGWDKILEGLREKINFSTPASIRFTIQQIWSEFIKNNNKLVEEGNDLIGNDLTTKQEVSKETIDRLRKIIHRLTFPKELELFIQSRTEELKGWVINRSSGRWEDSFIRNLAGIFISPKKRDERLVVQGIKEIFDNAINRVWIAQNTANAIEGIPNTLSAEEGFGVVIQPFISFDASGTAMSDLYGHTAIEAVIGDVDTAVRPVYANLAQFLFKKDQPDESKDFKYNPTFLNTPYEFRLKGKSYSVNENPDDMAKVLQSYPKINGKFSPLNREQAIELNRVINALEDEIGVPLDVEWGFMGDKLYIIQIRPIIGDFKKPLVTIDKNLEKKPTIAETPISLGETQSQGFTGKVVLFGSGTDQEIVKQFEDEFNQDYIRVQPDIASCVLGITTKAKVLVDVDQGSRQAHNINLITNRISGGEFAYANGPILREGLEHNLDFDSHPKLKGIWVSRQEVTYFSDGLQGSFYMGREAEREGTDIIIGTKAMLQKFQVAVKDIWHENSLESALEVINEVFYSGGLVVRTNFQTNLLLKGIMRGEDILECVEYHLVQSIVDEQIEVNLEMIEAWVLIMEEALSYPLYPNSWESKNMKLFQRLLPLKDIRKKLREKATEQTNVSVHANKYNVMLIDDAAHPKDLLKETLSEELADCNVLNPSTLFLDLAIEAVNKIDCIHFLHVHLRDRNNIPQLIEILEIVRQKNPTAEIYIESMNLRKDDFAQFQAPLSRKIHSQSTTFGDNFLEKRITEGYMKWRDERDERYEQEQETPKPEYPEKLRVLFVHDSVAKTRDMQCLLEKTFGLQKQENNCWDGEEFTVFFASDTKEAVKILKSSKTGNIDYVIADWLLQNDTASDLMIKVQEMGIKRVDIYTAAQGYIGQAKRMFPDLDIDEFPFPFEEDDKEKQLSCFKRERQKQIETYEQALARWQATQQRAVPERLEKPTKLAVLVVEDDAPTLDAIKGLFRDVFDPEEYKLFFARTAQEGLEILEGNDINLIIVDLLILNFDVGQKLSEIPHIAIISGLFKEDITKELSVIHIVSEDVKERASIHSKADTDYANQLTSKIKEARQQQIEAYEEALAEWEAAQPKVPTKPEGISILFVSDDPDAEFYANDYFSKIAGSKVKICFNANDAIKYMKSNRVDVLIADYNIPMLQDETSEDTTYSDSHIQAVLTTARETAEANDYNVALVVFSAHLEDYQKRALSEISDSIHIFYSTEPDLFQKFVDVIKQTQQRLIEDYDRALAQWQDAQSSAKKYNVFIYDFQEEYKHLEEFFKTKTDCSVLRKIDKWETDTKTLEVVSPWLAFCDAVEENDYNADFVFIHLGHALHVMGAHDIAEKVMAKNPNAIVLIEGGCIRKESADNIPHTNKGKIVKRQFSASVVLKTAEKCYTEWQDVQSEVKKEFNLVVCEHIGDHVELMEDIIEQGLNIEAKHIKERYLDVLEKHLESIDYNVDCLIVHLAIPGQIDTILEIFANIREKNPDSMLMIEYGIDFSSIALLIRRFSETYGEIKCIESPSNLSSLYKEIAEVCERKYGRVETQDQMVKSEAETMFIVNNSSQEANDLAELITETFGDKFNVVTMDSLFMFERALRNNTPAIVITDMFIDGNDELDNVYRQVIAKNPEARFIITSEEAAIPRKEFRGKNVMGVIEKPFYFQNVLDILDGIYEDKAIAAKERFKIEEAGRIVKDVERAHTQDNPGIIKIWEEYAAPQLQKSMLTRIRKGTENGPYQVGFDDIDTLVDDACKYAQNKNAVTILPYHRLTDEQRERLEAAKAQVVYMDFEKDMIFNENDIVQIGAIIFTGISYLNDNNNAFINLYRLLTGKKPEAPITVRQLKEHPELLIFLLKPATIHDYQELKHLNERMEEVL